MKKPGSRSRSPNNAPNPQDRNSNNSDISNAGGINRLSRFRMKLSRNNVDNHNLAQNNNSNHNNLSSKKSFSLMSANSFTFNVADQVHGIRAAIGPIGIGRFGVS